MTPKITNVFLGATAADVRLYRHAVRDTIQEKQIALFLQEDWEDGAEDVVLLCERRLREISDAYIGIFGFRYGWVPSGHVKSITEMECFWALDRWPRHQPCPVFLFQPEANSEAEAFLREQADAVLQKDYPNAPEKWQQSKQEQKAFLQRLGTEHRRIMFFSNKHDLSMRAWNAIRHWNGDILGVASLGGMLANVVRIPPVPASLLGAIDNAQQRRELTQTLKALKSVPDCPGVCILAHGERGMGQQEFLCFLDDWFREEWDGWKPRAHVHDPIRPHTSPWTPTALLRTIFAQLAPGQQAMSELPAAVANVVLQRCADQPQVLRLSQVDALEGRVDAFEGEVWTPLFTALRNQRKSMVHKHKLAVIASVDHGALPAQRAQDRPRDPDLALGRSVVLPAFEPFAADAVCEWLRSECRAWIREWLKSSDIEGEPLGEEARNEVATMVLAKVSERSRVFERLAKVRLWSDSD